MNINIVSFNIPFPANYGGVIDVFYKIKALYKAGAKITLHCFEYGREHSDELNKYCAEVYYYKRKTGFLSQLSTLPYIVKSRENENLLRNLLSNNYPILFEGLHTCYYINNPELRHRTKIVRAHNIEHHYYSGLAKTSGSVVEKIFFTIEKFRLKKFESQLKYSDYIIPLSLSDASYYKQVYGENKTVYIPVFHQNKDVDIKTEVLHPYLLFHGDLSVSENINAAIFLIENVAKADRSLKLIIAGKNPDTSIKKSALSLNNVSVQASPNHDEMQDLVRNASINILYAKHPAGVKLKLINTLYSGRYCIANHAITEGSGLDSLCIDFPENQTGLLKTICEYYEKDFDEKEIIIRQSVLNELYNNDLSSEKIIKLIK
ncbi:hypothetical protein M2132_001585 [Dysgonomonas sp. PH5-45]|uniref:glycosyltransferase n=1 Tax=unclassified Dysgonomonas TaxID=2630389 RepID=UPI0024731DCE|nr:MULTISPECIES: glycosyltransferase [unclassified Dysgonomonas]MDH6355247.1 hypothetical protein [Dysgonomonas sp. PH5-45]MDH6388131.1 hypothetical protein [Dysgonomonas sp. PH5-37]